MNNHLISFHRKDSRFICSMSIISLLLLYLFAMFLESVAPPMIRDGYRMLGPCDDRIFWAPVSYVCAIDPNIFCDARTVFISYLNTLPFHCRHLEHHTTWRTIRRARHTRFSAVIAYIYWRMCWEKNTRDLWMTWIKPSYKLVVVIVKSSAERDCDCAY